MDIPLTEVSERLPFTDNELQMLRKCHQLVFHFHPLSDNSVLVKFARASVLDNLDPSEVTDRIDKVRTCEESILPNEFPKNLLSALLGVELIGTHDTKDHLFQFLEGLAECGRRSPQNALKIIFHCCCSEKNVSEPLSLINLCYRLSIASDYLSNANLGANASVPMLDPPHAMVASLKDAIVLSNGQTLSANTKNATIDFETFEIWADINAPNLHATLGTFIHFLLFYNAPFPVSKHPFILPTLSTKTSSICENRETRILFEFASMSPHLGGKWNQVYSSDADGACFNRFQRSLLGFSAPTLFLIRAKGYERRIFGAFTSTPWKESKHFFGDGCNCFLFQIEPRLRVYYPLVKGRNFLYFNSRTRTKGNDGYAHGCGFGGDMNQPRLFITESFEKCFAGSRCQSFDDGPLIEEWNEYFDVDSLEVWGIGSEVDFQKACEEREEYWNTFQAHANDAKRVDPKQLLPDFVSEANTGRLFSHRDQTRGRHEFQVDDKHGGYVLERSD